MVLSSFWTREPGYTIKGIYAIGFAKEVSRRPPAVGIFSR